MRLHTMLLYALVGMAVCGAALVLDRVWFQIVPWDTFIKLSISLVILAVLDGFLMIVRADFSQHKKLKDDNYLD